MRTFASWTRFVAATLLAVSLVAAPGLAFADQAPEDGNQVEVVETRDGDATDAAGALVPEAPINGIPTVTIFVDETSDDIDEANNNDPDHSYGTFGELLDSWKHSVCCIGSVSITVPDGYASEYGSSDAPEGVLPLEFMRGRGNSTWGDAYKKAFKLKFQDKQGFLGMAEAKEWALMASAFDETLLDNRLASWMGHQMGLPYTPKMVPVDLVVVYVDEGVETGRERLGSYCLSELVEVGANRLDIGKLKADVTSEDPDDEENITGGYLLSLFHPAQDDDEPQNNRFVLDPKRILYGRGPEFEGDDYNDLGEGRAKQHDYIYDYLQQVDTLVMGDDGQGTTAIDKERHDAIAELMDLDSAADYWWTQVFSRNKDGFLTASTYLYKPRGDKLYWGPLWDFDQAFEREVSGFTYNRALWLDTLRERDPRFAKLLRDRWLDPENGFNVRTAELVADGGPLDVFANEIRDSWVEDNEIYPVKTSPFRDLYKASFDETMVWLRDWIKDRRDWINEHIDEVGVMPEQVAFVNDGEQLLACEGSVAYCARVALPDLDGCDWGDARMTFTVQPKGTDGATRGARVVEVPYDQAVVTTDEDGRTVATFVLPLSPIELEQSVTSVFSYTQDGDAASVEQEETLEQQVVSFVDQSDDDARVAYAKALHDFGRTSYDFFAQYGNGNVTPEKCATMSGARYTEQFDWEGAKAGIREELDAIGTEKDISRSQIKKIDMSLRFDAETTAQVDIYLKAPVKVFGCLATCKGKTYGLKKISRTHYRVSVTGLRAQDLAEPIEIKGSADGIYSIRCSALSYAQAIIEKNAYGDCGNDLIAALYNYHVAAQAIAE